MALFTVILRKFAADLLKLHGQKTVIFQRKDPKHERFLSIVGTFMTNRLPLIKKVKEFSKNLVMIVINQIPLIGNVKGFMKNVAMVLSRGEPFVPM